MPTYRITSPDGKQFDVTAPEGANQDQVLEYAKSQWTKAPQAKTLPDRIDPSEGMSGIDLARAGFGKAFADLGRGAGQMLGLVSRDDVAESRRLDAALMNRGAAKAGNFAGNLAALAPTAMIPGANTMTGAALIGGGAGLVQPSTSTGETLTNIGMGTAGSMAGQTIANKLGAALRTGTGQNIPQQQAAQTGKALGFTQTPGQATGSKTLQRVEAALESNPMTARPFDKMREGNQTAMNRIAAKSIGENADTLGVDVLQRAESRMGQVFDKVADQTPVALDPQKVGARLKQIASDSEGLIGGNGSLADNALFKRLDEFVNSAGGATREQLRTLSSKLGKAAKNNMTTPSGDRELGAALFDMKSLVDAEVMGTLQGAAKQEFADTMKQYGTLMNLTARGNVVNPSSGNVNARALASLLQQKDKGGFVFGKNKSDLYEAARFAQAFPEIVGNSGTATRSMGAADYLSAVPGSLLSRAYLSAPGQAMFQGVNGGTKAVGLLGATAGQPLGVLGGLGGAGLLSAYVGQ